MATNNNLAALQAQMRKLAVDGLCDRYHGKCCRGKGPGGKDAAVLTVNNWDAVKLFMLEPPTADANPAGPDFNTSLIPEMEAAIEAQDAARLWETALLICKAVRRGN